MLKSVKKKIHSIYRKLNDNFFICTIAYYFNNVISGIWDVNRRSFRYKGCDIKGRDEKHRNYNTNVCKVKIAFVCDDMTYINFKTECNATFLTPNNWFDIMETFKPDIFFCESAWFGIKEYNGCWRGRVYHNEKVKFENRKDLLNILDYCKKKKIKTVFWNKEDPTYYGDTVYNFVDTALKFDYIFTTAKECVEKYMERGHKRVYVLMFGFSPRLYNPLNSNNKKDVAVFAGSWYEQDKNRCFDMEKIFQLVLKHNIELIIYDRNYQSSNSSNSFPAKYSQYIKGKVNFEELGEFIKRSKYSININTVKDSETMFARRVFELMASNVLVISNFSKGLYNIFKERIWFVDNTFDKNKINQICSENIDYVFQHHTNQLRLEQILSNIDYKFKKIDNKISVIFCEPVDNMDKKCDYYIKASTKEVFYTKDLDRNIFVDYDNNEFRMEDIIINNPKGYFILANMNSDEEIFVDKLIPHFQYINNSIGIKKDNNQYKIVRNNMNRNVLFSIDVLDKVLKNESEELEKYYL